MIVRAVTIVTHFAARAVIALLLLVRVPGGGVQVSAREPLPSAAFFEAQTADSFKLSPTGDGVAFIEFSPEGACLGVADPKDVDRTRRVLRAPGVRLGGGVTSFLWIDSETLAFTETTPSGFRNLAARIVGYREPNFIPTFFVLAEDKEQAVLSGVCKNSCGSLGTVLSLPAAESNGRTSLWWVSVDGRERELLFENSDSWVACTLSREGRVVAGIRGGAEGERTLAVHSGGISRDLLRTRPGETLNIVGLSSSGESVFVATNAGEDLDLTRLEKINVSTALREVLDSDVHRRVDVGEVLLDRTDESVLGVRYFPLEPFYVWKDPCVENIYQKIAKNFPEGHLRIADVNVKKTRFIVTHTSDTRPEVEYLYDAEDASIQRLDSGKFEIDKQNLGRMLSVSYRARDGSILTAYLTLPEFPPNHLPPVIVFPHGGPNKRNYWGYDPRVQFFANRGYAVFQPNFRGSSGFGKRFQDAGNKNWGRGVMQDDITDGVLYLISGGIVHPDKVVIFGGSYGGFAALAGVAFTPDLYAAGVSLFGPSDLARFVTEMPATWRPLQGEISARIGDPRIEKDRATMYRQSPLHFVDQIRCPLFIYHGSRDNVVRKSQADAFVAAAKTHGLSVRYLVSRLEGHGFSDSKVERAVYVSVERFLAEVLSGDRRGTGEADLEKLIADLEQEGRN